MEINRPYFDIRLNDYCYVCDNQSEKVIQIYGVTEKAEYLRICFNCIQKIKRFEK